MLLQELSRDLRSNGLSYVARIPIPRVGERYRDLLMSIYKSSGNALATLWLEMDDGTRRIYSLYIHADIESCVDSLLEAPARVSGHLIEIKDGGASFKEYAPLKLPIASEIFPRIEEMAKLYRLSEDRILNEKTLESYYDWI